MWYSTLIGVAVVLLMGAGVSIVPQAGRTHFLNGQIWQALIVLMTGMGWAVGLAPAVMAARRAGWQVVVIYLASAAVAFALVWTGTERGAALWARIGAMTAGIAVPVAVGVWLVRMRDFVGN